MSCLRFCSRPSVVSSSRRSPLSFRSQGRRLRLLLVSSVLVLLVSGCSLFGSEDERVEADIFGDRLVVTNNTSDPIWTFPVGQTTLAAILWGPSLEGESIAPGTSRRTPLREVTGGDDETIVVFWWTARIDNGEAVPGEVHSIVVER